MALAETALAGLAGTALGLGAALAIGAIAFGSASFGASTTAAVALGGWLRLAGLAIAAAAIALPARRDARAVTVAGARRTVGPDRAARRGGCAPAST